MFFSFSRKEVYLNFLIFFIFTIYSLGIALTSASIVYSHLLTISLIIALLIIVFKLNIELYNYKTFIVFPFFINLGLLVGTSIFHRSEELFYTFDTYNNFFPKSDQIVNMISSGNISFLTRFDWKNHFLIFDLINSIPMIFFGKNVFILVMTLAIYKMFTCLLIYQISKCLIDKEKSKYAILIYAFNPVYILHTSLVFKEAFIHLIVSFFLYFLILINENQNKKYLKILSILICFIGIWERVYLIIPFTFGVLINEFFKDNFKRNYKFLFMTTFLFFIFGFFIASLYETKLIGFGSIVSHLKDSRDFYSTYSDVNKEANYGIGYGVAYFKIMFSPYFTFNKFNLFRNFSNMIIWGSFVNQLILLVSYLGIVINFRKNILTKVAAGMLFVHLAFIAYLAPYGFRQRDSLAPILAIWSAVGITYLIHKKKLN